MEGHSYEYKVLVEYINPEERGQIPHFTHEADQTAFTRIIEDVFKHLSDTIPSGWEVNSHNITFSRDTMIVTILLRRPAVG